MKKLLLAASVAATSFIACATITNSDGFETNGTAYGDDEAPVSPNYPFDDFGEKYLAPDDEEPTSLAANGGTVFDMFVQFTYREDGEIGTDGKLGVYANTEGNLVVAGGTTTTTATYVAKDSWHRLTIAASGTNAFIVYLNGTRIGEYTGAKENNTVTSVGVEGSGKVDNFVARTTNPFSGAPTGWIAKVGDDPEQYFTDYTDALKAALAGDTLTFADGETEMDGTAEHPFEIRSAADLKALQAAVADGNGADKCYVQTADIALTEAWPGIGIQNGKDIVSTAAFDNGAFKGTYDGGNHTISGFQMVGQDGNPANVGKESSKWEGLDYCGFFNSTSGATIKNLKIQYAGALFAADTTASTKESGATFVGVAKNSTLQNLTSLQKDAETAVSCSKGFGGIVGYTTSGTTVDSCTNNVNMTSLANNKCGGIAMITQTGAAVTIRNCQNNGTQTTDSSNSEYGAIVGYVGLNTTIADCETTVGRFLKHNNNTVTLQGVNKGDARVASYHGAATPGLNFATVAGDVATFVADNALATDGTQYKVMNANAAYEFTAAGTLVLDEALTNATVTAAEGLVLTTSTSGTVTTYTAAAAVAKIDDTKYTSLAAALAAATDGATVKLLADVAAEGTTISKSLTLDLGGKTLTGRVTIDNGTVTVQNGTIAGRFDTYDSATVTLAATATVSGQAVVWGDGTFGTAGCKTPTLNVYGTITNTGDAAISCNGTDMSGAIINIYGGAVVTSTDDVAVFLPSGNLTVSGGTITGTTGIYAKSGTMTVTGGTITGNGAAAAYVYRGDGATATGDAIVIDNAGYPGGAPAPSISGGTFISVNASAIASYAKTGLERIVHFADKDKVTITEAVASAEDVFLVKGFPGGADGKTFTIDGEVTLPTGKALTDTASAATGLTYAQAAVLGLLDEDGALKKDVTPTIEVKDDKVVVSLDGTAVDAKRYTVMLNVYQKTSLTAEWPAAPTTSYELGSETEAAGFTPASGGKGFYKVGVTIENK